MQVNGSKIQNHLKTVMIKRGYTVVAAKLEEWAELYNVGFAILDFAPWAELLDHEVFGIETSDWNEMAWVRVTATDFASLQGLQLLMGGKGLHTLLDNETGLDAFYNVFAECDSWAVEFDTREFISVTEKKLLLQLGYGWRTTVPRFYFGKEGYSSQLIEDRQQVIELTSALIDILAILRERVKDDPHLFRDKNARYNPEAIEELESLPVFRCRHTGTGTELQREWVRVEDAVEFRVRYSEQTYDLCQRVLRNTRQRGFWEVEIYSSYETAPYNGKEAFLQRLNCFDIEDFETLLEMEYYPGEEDLMMQRLLEMMLKRGIRPEHFKIGRDRVYFWLFEVAGNMRIQVTKFGEDL